MTQIRDLTIEGLLQDIIDLADPIYPSWVRCQVIREFAIIALEKVKLEHVIQRPDDDPLGIQEMIGAGLVEVEFDQRAEDERTYTYQRDREMRQR